MAFLWKASTLENIHWWHEVILRPAKSNAKSLFACQNLAPTFGRVSNWEKFPN
jgi:hypothetical protein